MSYYFTSAPRLDYIWGGIKKVAIGTRFQEKAYAGISVVPDA